MTTFRSSIPVLYLCLASVISAGCAGMPLASWNPYYRNQWEHDEKIAPTYHAKIRDLVAIRSAAPQMTAAEQEDHSQKLLVIYREDRNTQIAAHAIAALAEFPTAASLEGLRLAVEHADQEVRMAGCRGWGRKQSPEALDTLARILGSDSDLDVRLAAADELKAYRDPKALQALGLVLGENNPALQYRAIASLKQNTGRDLGNNVDAWRQSLQDGNLAPAQNENVVQKLRSWF